MSYLDNSGVSYLWSKIKAAFAAKSHIHAASDISSGTLDIARIPTGSTSSTVSLGNHTHSGYASSSHNHAASDINSGTLDIARIPTGSTSSTVALGNHTHSGYASSSHAHGSITNAGAITSDTTVASGDKLVMVDASDSSVVKRSNIAIGTSTDTYLRNDGTWSTPEGGATYTTATATLTVAGWSSNSQTVNVSGVTASSDVIVTPASASVTDYASAGIVCTAQGAGTLTFTCTATPSSAITVNVMAFTGGGQ